MAYVSSVIEVMIASPSDVTAERNIVREVIGDWNVVNSRSKKIILLGVGWETHSAPDLSGRPQQIINDRILSHCDLLVGIFWTRIGSVTGPAVSGTVKEINNHMAAGKPVMLYFSTRPVVPDSIDGKQYEKLIEFKGWASTKGLISSFDSEGSFRNRFRMDLDLNLRDNPYLARQMASVPPEHAQPKAGVATLSEGAASLLKSAAESSQGEIVIMRHIGGTQISAGGATKLSGWASAREVAQWIGAIDSLENLGYISATSAKREIFKVTNLGYEMADRLSKKD